MTKWYSNLTCEEILNTFVGLSKQIIELAEKGYDEESEQLENLYCEKIEEVIPSICDMKTMYWEFRHNNNVYETWDNLHYDIFLVKKEFENKLMKIYL